MSFPLEHIANIEAFFKKLGATYEAPTKMPLLELAETVAPPKLSKLPEEVILRTLDAPGCYREAVALLNRPPKRLLFREAELKKIATFLSEHSPGGVKRVLNISGVPGVGKRTAVRSSVQELQERFPVRLAEVAAWKGASSNHLYSGIFK